MAYGNFKDLIRRIGSDKILHDKAFSVAKNQRGSASMIYQFFDKKNVGGAAMLANKSTIKNENMSNKELANSCTSQLLESV